MNEVKLIKGWDVLQKFNEMDNRVHDAMRYGLYRVGKVLEKTASDGILRATKTGRYYKYKGKTYRASSAGQYPANVSGKNRRSIGFDVIGKKQMRFGARVGYSEYLVKGTRNMEKRDFLYYAYQDSLPEQKKILLRELNKAIKK